MVQSRGQDTFWKYDNIPQRIYRFHISKSNTSIERHHSTEDQHTLQRKVPKHIAVHPPKKSIFKKHIHQFDFFQQYIHSYMETTRMLRMALASGTTTASI